jgi:hypothetical protein
VDATELQSLLNRIETRWAAALDAHRFLLAVARDAEPADELARELALRLPRDDFRRAYPARGRFRGYLERAPSEPRPSRGGDEAGLVLLEDCARVGDEQTRAPDPSKGGSSGDPEVQVGSALKRLRAIFPTTYAVCFKQPGRPLRRPRPCSGRAGRVGAVATIS